MTIEKNIPLNTFTTFHVGGPAHFFCVAKTTTELKDGLRWAYDQKLQYFILGGGSNILFPDSGFVGLVIKAELISLAINDTEVTVGAGVQLSTLISSTLDAGLVGLEFAAGIPGSVGGAIRGNAGTFGINMSDVIQSVEYIDDENITIVVRDRASCGFAYRHSVFKNHSYCITSAKILLARGDTEQSKKVIVERIQKRHEKHPLEPSAGCIFKNVEFDKIDIEALKKIGVPIEEFSKYKKIPTGYLIEQLGLKGKTIGGAQVSLRHANYIINTGAAKSDDVVMLISLIKQKVRDAYGIQLEMEVELVE